MSLRCNVSPQDKIQNAFYSVPIVDSEPKAWELRRWFTTKNAVQSHSSAEPTISNPAYVELSRPSLVSIDSSTSVSFQNAEHGGHYSQLDAPRQRNMSSICQAHLPYAGDLESPELSDVSKVDREKSLACLDPDNTVSGHRPCSFRSHVTQLEQEGNAGVGMVPWTQWPTATSW